MAQNAFYPTFARMQPFTESGNETLQETDTLEMTGELFNLVVWNDEVNTFDWVIKALMDICGHEQEQAEQCTLIIHFNGKCSVKHGDYNDLKTMCDAITDRGIGATVEEMAA